jgi:PAS domain S-box-containing protein
MFGSFIDISEQKKSEEEMFLANERLQYLLSSTSAVIYSARISGDYGATFITSNVTQMTGYKPDDFTKKSDFWLDKIHTEDKQRIQKEITQIFDKDYHIYEYRFQIKDGTFIWVRDEMKLVRDENGRPLEIIGYWIDITEKKEAEKALQESYGILEQRVKERTNELTTSIKKMKEEIRERRKAEKELRKSEGKLRRSQAKLKKQALALEQKNIALREIIAQIEIEKRKIKEDIASNIDTVFTPIIEGFKRGDASPKYVHLLEHHLEGLASSFGSRVREDSTKLTPREIEICSMIKGGLTSKDISRLINVSRQTVERHRKNIRRKFGITNRGINLTSFLREL